MFIRYFGLEMIWNMMNNQMNFETRQIIWAIKMNFKSWDLFKHNFGIKFIIATYKDWKRRKNQMNRVNKLAVKRYCTIAVKQTLKNEKGNQFSFCVISYRNKFLR